MVAGMPVGIDSELLVAIEALLGVVVGSSAASLVACFGRLVALAGSAGMSRWGRLGTVVVLEVTVVGPGRRRTALADSHLVVEVVQGRWTLVLGWKWVAVVGLSYMVEVFAA